MIVTAIEPFRHRTIKGRTIVPGETIDVDESYASQLLKSNLVVAGVKAMPAHENKMLPELKNK